MAYPQNDDRIVAIDFVTSLHPMYTVSQKKTRHQTLAHNFTKYWPILKILSALDSLGNL